MMNNNVHLVIQIPCFNEATTLPIVLRELPREIPGVAKVDILVIDDGSTDGTAQVAYQAGADYVVQHQVNRGVAATFQTGLDAAIRLGADIIVNTDGDNQYPGQSIPALIQPILQGRADIVIGDRQTSQVVHFSIPKRVLQRLGSGIVGIAAGTPTPDAVSGFRAFSRLAAQKIHVVSTYSYTVETIIQAAKKRLRIVYIPIAINTPTRKSRLISSMLTYVLQQAFTVMRVYVVYEPFRTFTYASLPFILSGSVLIIRFLVLYALLQTGAGRHIQSLVVGSMLMTVGILIFLNGIIAHIVGANRLLLEEILFRQKQLNVDIELVDRD